MINSGIYKIQSKIKPERFYIGSSVNINNRFNAHLHKLRNNIHENIKLQRHYNKYGIADLEFSIYMFLSKSDLINVEQYFIDTLKPYFNIRKIAHNNLGIKWSSEAKERQSKKFLNRTFTEETKLNMSKSHLGKHKINLFPRSDKGKSHLNMIGTSYALGHICSDEAKKIMSEKKLGHICSDETKKIISEKMLGHKKTYFGKIINN